MIFEGLFQLKLFCDSVLLMVERSFVTKQDVSSPMEKDLGALVGERLHVSQQSVRLQLRRLITSWAAAKLVWPAR